MTHVYLNPPSSSPTMSFLEFKGDQHSTIHQVFGQIHDLASSTCDESLAIGYSSRHPHHNQEMIKIEKVLSHDKPHDLGQVIQSSSPWPQNIGDGSGSCSYGFSSNTCDKVEFVTNNTDQKYSRRSWKPSKLRIVQKMTSNNNNKNMGEQHKIHHDRLEPQQNNMYRNNNNNNGIRVCSDCHTTTTPLWRSGPQGPKSLCNACGIRQRKARRAAMAAAEAAGYSQDGIVPSMSIESPSQQQQQQQQPKVPSQDHQEIIMRERSFEINKSHPLPLKKRGKTIDFANNNNMNHNNKNTSTDYDSHHKNGLVSSSNNHNNNNDYFTANSQRSSFPRDEEEGAFLLMALSCGLACSS